MAALAGRELDAVHLAQIAGKTKRVTDDYFRLAEIFGSWRVWRASLYTWHAQTIRRRHQPFRVRC
jgi:hypothetical protein